MATAADWMTPMPVTVKESDSLARAAVLLSRHAFRHLPVVDDEGLLTGIALDYSVFSRGALVWGGKAGHELWFAFDEGEADAQVSLVTQAAQGVVRASDPLENCLRTLARIGQDMLVVVDEQNRPMGVISEHDPMRYASEIISPVREAMLDATSPVLTATEEEPAVKALGRMVDAGIRHLPIVDEQGAITSVVSYRDLVSACGDGSPTRTVRLAIASPGARVLLDDASTAGCARVMAEGRIGCLPIVNEDGHPIAIITRTDVIRAAADQLEDENLFIS